MRLKEIEERLAAIKNELTTRAAELKEEEITALENEVTALQEERAAIKAAAEKRSALLARIAAGESVGDGEGDGSGQQRVLRNFKGAAGEGDNDDKYGSMEYRKAFMKYVCRGEALPKEYRADAVSKSTDVGAVIPTTVLNQIVEKLESTGMILALVTRTAYKGGVSIPVSTVKPTATWVNEGAGSDKQKKNIAKDGMITFAYHKLRCAVAVSLEVDTMAISAFETLLINNIVEAMTKALEQAIIDGNGTGKPKGILAETPADGQTIESAAPSYSDLIKAEGALPMAYENGAVWCMSKKTFMEYVELSATLVYEYGGFKRVIDCRAYGEPKILKKEVLYEFDLQIECLNPFWREEEETKEDIASWVAAWHFPCVIEKDSTKSMIYGYRAESVIVDCYNEGDVSTGMRIRFTALGTVSNPILLNVDTEEFIQINATMKTGDVIEINTKYGSKGAKLIRDGVETDYFRYIDVDSTFMQLAIGDNMFRYDAASGVNSLEVSIFYSKEFLGV